MEDGTSRAAGVESGFAATFTANDRSPKPELEFHHGGATGVSLQRAMAVSRESQLTESKRAGFQTSCSRI